MWILPGAAREHVRVARGLAFLPLTVSLFSTGELTYAKVRAITRVATPENEELLVHYARAATASQLERIVRGYRRAGELEETNTAYARRSLSWSFDGEGGHMLTVRMTAEEKAVTEKALEEAASDVPSGTGEGRLVDAFVAMARSYLASDIKESSDAFLVNLNVTAETLADDADGECDVDGHDICPETARRLSCDAPVVVSLLDRDGVVLEQGRKSRLFTGPARAAVMKRDRGTCIFPGCEHRKWVDVHHIWHWTKGGPTDPWNGAVLCGFHHRLVHEGGFSLDHDFVFRTPTGDVVPDRPQPVHNTATLPKVRADACVSEGNGAPFDLADAVTWLSEGLSMP